MIFFSYAVLAIYTIALLYITIYCVMQFNLLYHYKKAPIQPARQEQKTKPATQMTVAGHSDFSRPGQIWDQDPEDLPFVTIQLPIFNEMYVAERLIDNIMEMDYHRDRFEVHVLDDSTDETIEVTARKVAEYQGRGFQIEQYHRTDRQGFKAGALKEGMRYAKGDFIAIFDADFLPRPDFLRRTLPHFDQPAVGVVQTRWEHINEDYSLITRLQALQLNVHFTVEQVGRMKGNYLLQFNGTAGIWRRQTIEDAGGWEADTLTEDLDLSIRAQLRGWKIRYLEEVGAPAELPAEMNSFKSQQFRWMKGGAETAKKMLPSVWRSDLKLGQKIQTTVHLLGSSIFVFVFIMGVFSVPLLFVLGDLIQTGFDKDLFAYFLVGLFSIISVYYVGNVQAPVHRSSNARAIFKFLFLFPLFLALSMGLSLHNTVAVLQGYAGKKSPFIRTPKFNIKDIRDRFSRSKYLTRKIEWTTLMEGLLALYFLGAAVAGIYLQTMTFFLFHLLLAFGYGAIFYLTLRHWGLKS